jgi:hypothetical protein
LLNRVYRAVNEVQIDMHADQLRLSTNIGGSIYRAGRIGLLTDAGVTAADTLAGMDTFIDSQVVHADQAFYKDRVKDAYRKTADINDAAVLNLTTVAGFYGLTNMGTNGRNTELLAE